MHASFFVTAFVLDKSSSTIFGFNDVSFHISDVAESISQVIHYALD